MTAVSDCSRTDRGTDHRQPVPLSVRLARHELRANIAHLQDGFSCLSSLNCCGTYPYKNKPTKFKATPSIKGGVVNTRKLQRAICNPYERGVAGLRLTKSHVQKVTHAWVTPLPVICHSLCQFYQRPRRVHLCSPRSPAPLPILLLGGEAGCQGRAGQDGNSAVRRTIVR